MGFRFVDRAALNLGAKLYETYYFFYSGYGQCSTRYKVSDVAMRTDRVQNPSTAGPALRACSASPTIFFRVWRYTQNSQKPTARKLI